jgi:hypothetical protein
MPMPEDGMTPAPVDNVIPEPGVTAEPTEPAFGKFGSADELLKGYQNLESEKGRLGNELGELRTRAQILQEQNQTFMDKMLAQGQPAPAAASAPDVDAQLEWIAKQVADGEMSPVAAEQHKMDIYNEQASRLFQQKFEEAMQQQEQKHQMDLFIQNNPNYLVYEQNGSIEQVLRNVPGMMAAGRGAAYQYLERQRIEAEYQEKITYLSTQAAEKGKQDALKALDTEARITGPLSDSPGSSAKPTAGSGGASLTDIGLAAIRRIREQRQS